MGKPSAKNWGVGAFGLLILVIGIALGFAIAKRGPSAERNDSRENAKEVPQTVLNSRSEISHAADAAPEAELAAHLLSEPTKSLILECLKSAPAFRAMNRPGDFSTLEDLVREAHEASAGSESNDIIHYRNVHIRTPGGEELRLHVAPQGDADGETALPRLKLFGVDRENLPVPRALPKELKALMEHNASPEAIERFKTQGAVMLEEVSYSRRLSEEEAIEILERDHRVERLQIFKPGGALGCVVEGGQTHCVCF